MAAFEGTLAERMTLVDVVDHLLNRGVVLSGGATLSLAGVDLVYLGLNVLVSSVETLQRNQGPPGHPPMGVSATQGLIQPRGPGRGPALLGSGPTVAERPHPHSLPEGEGADPTAGLRVAESERYPKGQRSITASPTPGDAGQAARPERDLARLVLTLVELLRQILERQAVRRMEGGTLPEEDIERMGLALSELEARMAELRSVFGLEEGDLNIDLGPLGQLT